MSENENLNETKTLTPKQKLQRAGITAAVAIGLGFVGIVGYNSIKQTQFAKKTYEATTQQTSQDKTLADSANTTANSINESVASIDSILNAVADSNAFRVYETPSIFNVYDSINATITDHNGYVRDSIKNPAQIKYVVKNGNLNGYVNDVRDTTIVDSLVDANVTQQSQQSRNSNHSNNSSNSSVPESQTGDYVYETTACAGCLEQDIDGTTYFVDTSSIDGKREAYALGLLSTMYDSNNSLSCTRKMFQPTQAQLKTSAEKINNQTN